MRGEGINCLAQASFVQCWQRDIQTLRHSGETQTLRHSETQTVPERVIRSELQQRDGGDGEAVHVIAVCLLPTRREGRALPFPIHPRPSASTSTLDLHLYPQPSPLHSDSTITLNPHLYPLPPPLPPTCPSTLNLHL